MGSTTLNNDTFYQHTVVNWITYISAEVRIIDQTTNEATTLTER